MATTGTLGKQTIFDMAEKHMFDTVMVKVKRDILDGMLESYTAYVRDSVEPQIDKMLAEFATSEIKCMTDHIAMSDQYVIWLKHNNGDKEKV